MLPKNIYLFRNIKDVVGTKNNCELTMPPEIELEIESVSKLNNKHCKHFFKHNSQKRYKKI